MSLDAIPARGAPLYRARACERDLKGIVAKWARGTYLIHPRVWSHADEVLQAVTHRPDAKGFRVVVYTVPTSAIPTGCRCPVSAFTAAW